MVAIRLAEPKCRVCQGTLPGRRWRYCTTVCWVAWQVLKVREPGYSIDAVLERIADYRESRPT